MTWSWASIEGYRAIDSVPDDSRTETFVAARVWVDNDRWKGVPFLLRTGKCLTESHQRVSVVFKDPGTRSGRSARRSERARL